MIRHIAIVSLSAGIIGEDSVRHEVAIGEQRLKDYGVEVTFMPHARKSVDYVKNHPADRAADLLEALRDPRYDMILCAIGGDDTYRLLPWLFDHGELQSAARDKVFLGFSDTTVNHLMLHKVGMKTFYGQAFLPDVCEMSREMLPYTRRYFEELLTTGAIREITPSPVWYESRTDFGADQVGVPLTAHENEGFVLLQGSPVFSGKILGGCIDTLYDFFDGGRYADMPAQCARYGLFPSAEDWRGRILLLESSEEQPTPEKYRQALEFFKAAGVFRSVSGILAGMAMDRRYEEEYRRLLTEVVDDPELPIVCNLSVGHGVPRCIIPFGVDATVDVTARKITFHN